MKQFFILIGCITFITSCDIRKNNNKNNNVAAASQDTFPPTTVQIIDTTYDFGKVNEGEIVTYNYRFKNTGAHPLSVQNAVASCGCTIPEKPEKPVQPGEIGYIKVKFNSDHRPGEAHKTITVTSNANPEFPPLVLKGTVIGKDQPKN